MIPPLVVEEALQHGINLLAITDHNSAANAAAVQKAAAGTELTVLPGIELQTREEVHSLCLFDRLEQAQALQGWIDARLPNRENNPEFFGEQFIVDETGDFIRREERLLLNSVDASLTDAWEEVERLDGLLIPAHVNRTVYGLIAVLGMPPVDITLEALEISRHIQPEEACRRFPQIKGYPLLQNGDVHFLADFLGSTCWMIEQPSIQEFRMAIRGLEGRYFRIDNPPR